MCREKGDMPTFEYELHRLGWKAFQDLCVAIVEERLGRPVQTFLPSNDAGRDGAFLGRWDDADGGESTVQCKFTSKSEKNLTLSMLESELSKISRLANAGLARDYIILTNCGITGESDLQIKMAVRNAGAGNCRVYGRDWITARIKDSPTLRMMVPRLYGAIDLSTLLDERAYKQAQLILSEMGSNIRKLVVTESHRQSVRAISKHGLVLLLGSPAAGKSTIGASLALGAADIWSCQTIKSTSPGHLQQHIDPDGGQFFWVDDAWGSTQYQSDRVEAWNQVFPLMQGAIAKGSRFLITSRDYIWNAAKRELKLQAMPLLRSSQVVIDVHNLTVEERARIAYNHVKQGDQSRDFMTCVTRFLPEVVKRDGFLPESARRFGSAIFTQGLNLTKAGILDFFDKPREFLEDTIENLSADCKAAIALVFMSGGNVRSPVSNDSASSAAAYYGVSTASVKAQLEALNGSLLNLVLDEEGPYWTYHHPTIGDAFAGHVAKSPEMIEVYLAGARAETIVREVVCAGVEVSGAQVVVPDVLHDVLIDKIASQPKDVLGRFISRRANAALAGRILSVRPDIWDRLSFFYSPLKHDPDVVLLARLHEFGLLPEERRESFFRTVRDSLINLADDSFLDEDISPVLTEVESSDLLAISRQVVARDIASHVDRLKKEWDTEYDPETHFEDLEVALTKIINATATDLEQKSLLASARNSISQAVSELMADYEPPPEASAPVQESVSQDGEISEIFRDLDE